MRIIGAIVSGEVSYKVNFKATLLRPDFVEAMWRYAAREIAHGYEIHTIAYDAYEKWNGLWNGDDVDDWECDAETMKRCVAQWSRLAYIMRTEADLRNGLVTKADVPLPVLHVMESYNWDPYELWGMTMAWASSNKRRRRMT
jgi:hypothetical protein